MITRAVLDKLKTLADSAKYDASCASSGVSRSNSKGGVGNATAYGICHSFTEDGRCQSLLKVLYSNACKFDCAYCVNRSSNDRPRASFEVEELAELVIEFYRRNYIEGLFLSSAVVRSPDYTMERMIEVMRRLRTVERFGGYIHLKGIPGASRELVYQAGLLADRMSVNIEIPSERNLKMLAPDKDYPSVYSPMRFIQQLSAENREDRRKYRHAPQFVPGGQSTQMIVGASNDRDRDIIKLASLLYKGPGLKRVYYSGYVPVNTGDKRLPGEKPVPLVRENRLYQADWLMRRYMFEADEILDDEQPDLDLSMDPKLAWALRHPEFFPVDVNRASLKQILRVPGIGERSAKKIVAAQRHGKLGSFQLKQIGVVMKRAKYFLALPEPGHYTIHEAGVAHVRQVLTGKKREGLAPYQLSLLDVGTIRADALRPAPPVLLLERAPLALPLGRVS